VLSTEKYGNYISGYNSIKHSDFKITDNENHRKNSKIKGKVPNSYTGPGEEECRLLRNTEITAGEKEYGKHHKGKQNVQNRQVEREN
jgi:hypothetical protein